MKGKGRRKKKRRAQLTAGAAFAALFLLLIAGLMTVDRQPIGSEGSTVGFAGINGGFHELTGVNMGLYNATGILGYAAIAVALCFCLLALFQLIKRKSLGRVDRSIYALIGLYIALGAIYIFFEKVVVNYRPVDLGEGLEPSFPSSHTMLACCIMGSAIHQLRRRISSGALRGAAVGLCAAVMAATVIGRTLCGVHWLTDILGGLLISAALLCFYRAAAMKR